MVQEELLALPFEDALHRLGKIHHLEVKRLLTMQEQLLKKIDNLQACSGTIRENSNGPPGPNRMRRIAMESRKPLAPTGEEGRAAAAPVVAIANGDCDGQIDDTNGSIRSPIETDSKQSSKETVEHSSSLARLKDKNSPRISQRASTHAEALKERLSSGRTAASKMMGDHYEHPSLFERVVFHEFFNAAVASLILVNCFFIIIEVSWLSTNLQIPGWLQAASYTCSAFFFCELVLRVLAQKKAFILDPGNVYWNLFDAFMVACSVFEPIVNIALDDTQNISSMYSLKLLKLLRVFRIFRVLRFLRALMKIALMVIDSLKSLVWAIVLISFIMYVFCITLTMRASEWLKQQVDTNDPDWYTKIFISTEPTVIEIRRHYSSLGSTLYTLLQAILGGISWHEVCDPLLSTDPFSAALLLMYILFMMLAVLNVITAVFVDNAFRSAELHKDLKIKEEMDKKEDYTARIREFFEAMDEDGSGEVTPEELESLLCDDTLSAYFRILGFEVEDPRRFIQLLDTDRSGSVSIREFVEGCMRCRGPAQGVDVHTIIHELRSIKLALSAFLVDTTGVRYLELE